MGVEKIALNSAPRPSAVGGTSRNTIRPRLSASPHYKRRFGGRGLVAGAARNCSPRYTRHGVIAASGSIQTCEQGCIGPNPRISRKPLSHLSGILTRRAGTLCAAKLACDENGRTSFAFFGGGVHQHSVLPSGFGSKRVHYRTVRRVAGPAGSRRARRPSRIRQEAPGWRLYGRFICAMPPASCHLSSFHVQDSPGCHAFTSELAQDQGQVQAHLGPHRQPAGHSTRQMASLKGHRSAPLFDLVRFEVSR